MYISEKQYPAPRDKDRGELELKTYEMLDKLKIEYEHLDNDEVKTMEETQAVSDALGTEIRKTLLLNNQKKTAYFMVVLPADKSLDTKELAAQLGSGRLSFTSPERMQKILGVAPGTASVMSLINDTDEWVQLILDQEVADAEDFACNPGANTSHLRFKTADLVGKVLPHLYHAPKIMAL